MRFLKLNASLIDGSGMNLLDSVSFQNDIREVFENYINDFYMSEEKGKEICMQILGDDINPPLTSIYGTFHHNGNEYSLIIPNDSKPAIIKIVLDKYGKKLAEKMAVRIIESRYEARNIEIKERRSSVFDWEFEIWFSGIEYRTKKRKVMRKKIKIGKTDGFESIIELINR